MKTRCPNCGATLSLDAIVAHEGARDALYAAFMLGGELGAAAVSYLGLFRPEKRELSLDRVAKLLNEILPDVQAQRITRNGTVYDAPIDAWVWAMREAVKARDAGRLPTRKEKLALPKPTLTPEQRAHNIATLKTLMQQLGEKML